ncbi:hypothetical protein QW180_10320 [Vibrio sinaloensis]|nr:hypothetical protein [Vibrio sinaloensis]
MLIVAAGVTWLQLDSTHNLPKSCRIYAARAARVHLVSLDINIVKHQSNT